MKKNKRTGQAIAEYLILTALIAIASIGIIQIISKNLRGKLNSVNDAIATGRHEQYRGDTNTSRQTKMIDMGDFNQTLTNSGGD